MALIRNAQPKPVKGTALLERRMRKLEKDRRERETKAAVRRLDKGCRWPRCECRTLRIRTEVAHLLSKSLGGEDVPENLIELCFLRHQGPTSLHSGDLRIECLTERGARGPCAFYEKDEAGKWQCVGVERSLGVSVAVGK